MEILLRRVIIGCEVTLRKGLGVRNARFADSDEFGFLRWVS